MEKQNKNIITSILLCTLLVFSFWTAFYPLRAYAQTFQVITNFSHSIIAMHYQADNDLIWILTGNTTDGRTVLYWVDRSTLSVVGSFNHTISVSGGVGNKPFDIWCGKTDCYVTTAHAASGVNGQILRISTEDIAPNIFRGQNVTGTYTHTDQMYHITGRDAVSGGFGSVTLWVDVCSVPIASGCADDLHIIDGISMSFVGELQNFGITNNDWRVKDMQWSGIEGITDNHLVSTHSPHVTGQANAKLYITNLATITTHCSVATPTISAVLSFPISVASNYVSAGSPHNKVYVGTNSGHVFVYDNNCNLLQTVNSTETGITGNVRYLEYSGGRVFMQSDGISAQIVQMLTNSSGHIIETDKTIYLPQPSTSQQLFDDISGRSTVGDMILFSGFGKLWFPYTGTDKKVGILIYDEDSPQGGSEFCQQPENFNLLRCVLERGDTTPLVGASELIDESTSTIICQLGLIACTNFVPNDPDTKTNGVGYIILVVALGILIGIFWVASRGDLGSIPTFLWFIATLAVIGTITAFDLIDATFLVISVIAIIALAVAKAKGIFGSSGLFAGET